MAASDCDVNHRLHFGMEMEGTKELQVPTPTVTIGPCTRETFGTLTPQ